MSSDSFPWAQNKYINLTLVGNWKERLLSPNYTSRPKVFLAGNVFITVATQVWCQGRWAY